MKKNLTLLAILTFVLSITFVACDKKEEKKIKTTKYAVKEDYVISSLYGISGYNIKDTINNIYGAMLVPLSKVKDNNTNIKPITDNIGNQMQEFVNQVKKNKAEGKNFIEIRPAYFIFYDQEIYSCLIKKTICFANQDTIKTYNTVLFNYKENKALGFDNIFSVTESNLSDFLALFSKEMSSLNLQELKTTDFNLETDTICFNVKQSSPKNFYTQKQYKQSIDNLRPFLKNKKQFTKKITE